MMMNKKQAYKLACEISKVLIDWAIRNGMVYNLLLSKNIVSNGEQVKVFDALDNIIEYLWKESRKR